MHFFLLQPGAEKLQVFKMSSRESFEKEVADETTTEVPLGTNEKPRHLKINEIVT